MASRRRFPSATAASVTPTRPSGLASPLRAYLRAEFAHALRASKGTRTHTDSLSLSGPIDGGTVDSAAADEAVGFAPDERKTGEGDGGATVEPTRTPVTKPAAAKHEPASSPESSLPRDYLRCEEVCTLAPPQDLPVRFSHLAVLFAIDANRDGRFSFRELEAFIDLCLSIRGSCKPHEFEMLLQGRCVTGMLRVIRHHSGVVRMVDWVMRMLADSYPTTCVGHGDTAVECISVDAVFVLYNVLCGGTVSALDFTPSQLLDLLHLAAEEQGLLDLDDGDLDDVVPVSVLRSFVENFVSSAAEVYKPMALAMPGLNRRPQLQPPPGLRNRRL